MNKINIKKIGDGHINDTFLFDNKNDKVVVQKLGKSFGEVSDISPVCDFLEKKKFNTIKVLKNWRVLNYIDGRAYTSFNRKQLLSALKITSSFHRVIQKFNASEKNFHSFLYLRKEYKSLPQNLPLRVIHGDMRPDNILFKKDMAIALIDLDTVHKGCICWDIANMIFSWCGGMEGKIRIEEINIIKKFYSTKVKFLTNREVDSIDEFVKVFALEIGHRFKDYNYFKKLEKSYCQKRSRDALTFYRKYKTNF